MSSTFSRSLRSVAADSSRRSAWLVALCTALAIAWLAWAWWTRVPVYEQSVEARLEVSSGAHDVQSPTSGAIASRHATLGSWVERGDVLLQLDSTEQQRSLEEKEAEMSALNERLQALERLLGAEHAAVAAAERAQKAALAEASARTSSAMPRRDYAKQHSTRVMRLRERGLASDAELAEAQADYLEAQRQLRVLRKAQGTLREAHRSSLTDRGVRLGELEREMLGLRASMAVLSSTLERARLDVELRTIRAPRSGTIGQLTALQPGSYVAAGDPLLTIVPRGELRVMAYFPAGRAIGRIRPGQPAQLQMAGFPWTEYGTLPAEVVSVGNEARNGVVSVELSLEGQNTTIPVQHGLSGVVDVEVDLVSPLTLLLRSVGRGLSPPDSSGAEAAPPSVAHRPARGDR